jgi:hypothetical protein
MKPLFLGKYKNVAEATVSKIVSTQLLFSINIYKFNSLVSSSVTLILKFNNRFTNSICARCCYSLGTYRSITPQYVQPLA